MDSRPVNCAVAGVSPLHGTRRISGSLPACSWCPEPKPRAGLAWRPRLQGLSTETDLRLACLVAAYGVKFSHTISQRRVHTAAPLPQPFLPPQVRD
jgi:hypothetical protein